MQTCVFFDAPNDNFVLFVSSIYLVLNIAVGDSSVHVVAEMVPGVLGNDNLFMLCLFCLFISPFSIFFISFFIFFILFISIFFLLFPPPVPLFVALLRTFQFVQHSRYHHPNDYG